MTAFDDAVSQAAKRAYPLEANHPALAVAQRRAFESGARWARAFGAADGTLVATPTPARRGHLQVVPGPGGAA